jgi:hypothetical protein
MSELFNKLKSIFVVTDPNSTQPNIKDDVTSVPSEAKPTKSNEGSVAPKKPSATKESATDDMIKILFDAIERNNLDGFDYLEFKNSLKSLENVIADEGTRYKSAYEMAKTMGLTKDALVKAAGHYISVLSEEYTKFNNSVEHQKGIKIQERASQLKALENDISQKQATIEKLTAEINADNEQLAIIKAEIDDSAQKIDLRSNQFKSSYALVHNQIEDDVKKINTYL